MSKLVPYQIVDAAALKEAYPEVYTPEVITRDVPNRELIYKVVKMNFELGRPTPGVVYKNKTAEETTTGEEK